MKYKALVHTDEEFAHVIGTLEAACLAALEHLAAAAGEVSIVLVGEDRMRQFNLEFADTDKPTDVLAFSDGSVDPDNQTIYHGDIIICFPIAALQASISGNSVSDELSLLTVHAVLHLLGYEHDTQGAKSAMWTEQAAILQKLGCTISFPEET